jgi:hypothetical protein
MKIILSLTTAILICFTSIAQEKITYKHCNCVDEIEVLNPKPTGKYTRICDNKVIETGNFSNGVKDGEWKSYSTEGTLIKVIHYSNGVLNGDVLFNYNNGKKKLSGSFSNGLKNGPWAFYTDESKLQWDAAYDQGKPIGITNIYDRKGKKTVISFNFDTDSYIKNDPNFSLHDKEPSIAQEATSGGWFVLLDVDSNRDPDSKKITDSQLFMSMLEIPSEYFNTYFKGQYNIHVSFENYGVKTLSAERGMPTKENIPVFAFPVMTNDPDQLTRIEPQEFSLFLLDSKIKEAFSMIQPWQIKNGDLDFVFIYVINEIGGREELDEK